MNTIQMSMQDIPTEIKTALQLLGGNFSKGVLKRLLPQVVENMKETATECVTLAKGTQKGFNQLMLLLGEVLETTVATADHHNSTLRENKKELAIFQKRKTDLEKQKEFRDQRYKEITDAVKRAEDTYYQALKDIPTGFDEIWKDFTRGIVKLSPKIIGFALFGPVGLLLPSIEMSDEKKDDFNPDINTNLSKNEPPSVGFGQTLVMVDEYSNSLESLKTMVSDKVTDKPLLKGFPGVFKAFRKVVMTLPENSAKSRVINLIERGEELAVRATRKGKKKLRNDTDSELINQLNKLTDELKPFQSAAGRTDPTTATDTLANLGKNTASATQYSSKNELFKAQLAQNYLIEVRRLQDKQASEYIKLLETITSLGAQMTALDFTNIQYEQIIHMLNQALILLGRLHSQWGRLVVFFTEISREVEHMARRPLKNFLLRVSVASTAKTADRMQLTLLLKDNQFGIHHQAYKLFLISRTYYDVSSRYLMGRLADLSNLLVFQSDTERTAKLRELEIQTNSTIDQVTKLVQERNKVFEVEWVKKKAELATMITRLGGENSNNQLAIDEGSRLIARDTTWRG